MEARPRKLLDQVRDLIRLKHYAYSTEVCYVYWIRRYILFHNKRHPNTMGAQEVEAFLTHLAVKEKIAASTQNQAFCSLLFLYRDLLHQDLGDNINAIRAKRSHYVPTVLTTIEALAIITELSGVHRLVAQLLYGSGLRLKEALRLRIKDIDFTKKQITVLEAKGGNSRVTMLPITVVPPLQEHLQSVQRLHQQDLEQGYGSVYLPYALDRKYPHADRQWIWQYVFPSTRLSIDPRGQQKTRRHHLSESSQQKAVKIATQKAGILKKVGCHTFRHSFATHLLENHYDIRTVQELLG